MLKGFKEFIARGNVVELAVAVVIGAAFVKVVDSLVANLINPIVGLAGSESLELYTLCLKGTCSVVDGQITGVGIGWGAVLSAAITFVLTAAVVYFFIVAPYNRLRERMNRHEPGSPGAEPSDEVLLLREIRDVLHQKS